MPENTTVQSQSSLNIGSLVNNYWDLAAAVAAGLAFNDTGAQYLGDVRAPIFVLSALSSGYRGLQGTPDQVNTRLARNLFAGFSAINLGENAQIANYITAGMSGLVAYLADSYHRKITPKVTS